MAAGLNQMVTTQSKMAITNPNTEHTAYNTHTDLAVLIRHSLKYKISLSENLLYGHRTSDASTNRVKENISGPHRFQREERKPGWKKREVEAGEGGKRGGLTRVSGHLQTPRCYGTLHWASREGRIGTWPYQKPDKLEQNQNSNQKPDQNRTRIWVLCQEEVIILQSSAQAEALWPDSCVQDWGIRRKG